MRLILSHIIIALLVSSCGGKSKEQKAADKKVLFGSWEGNTYKNSFFNFKIDIDDKWRKGTSLFQTSFGGALFEIKYLESVNNYAPITITVETEKANPFEKPSVLSQLNESIEGYEMLFDESEMLKTPASKTSIGGEDFLSQHIVLPSGADTSYVTEIMRFVDGYYLSIIAVYGTQQDEATTMEVIHAIKKLK